MIFNPNNIYDFLRENGYSDLDLMWCKFIADGEVINHVVEIDTDELTVEAITPEGWLIIHPKEFKMIVVPNDHELISWSIK